MSLIHITSVFWQLEPQHNVGGNVRYTPVCRHIQSYPDTHWTSVGKKTLETHMQSDQHWVPSDRRVGEQQNEAHGAPNAQGDEDNGNER